MVTGYRKDGKWIWREGLAAIDENCCCCPCSWFEWPDDTEQYASWEVKKGGGAYGPAVDTVEYALSNPWCPGEDWISTVSDNDLSNNDPSLDDDLGVIYTYRVKFEILNAEGVNCLRLLGLYSADNYCKKMMVNGAAIPAKPATPTYCKYGATTDWQFGASDSSKSDFVIDPSSGLWVMGENTLEWEVVNDSNDIDVELSPTGFWCAFYPCDPTTGVINNPDC